VKNSATSQILHIDNVYYWNKLVIQLILEIKFGERVRRKAAVLLNVVNDAPLESTRLK